jgi:4-hydroxy-3-polyprenylbenzoate decarboxylase
MYQDLREFITLVDKVGALRRIQRADLKFEIGGITEVAAGTADCPALLFEQMQGCAPDFRVLTNATATPARAALALGIDPTLPPLDALKEWMKKRKTLRSLAPVAAKTASFLENSMRGTDVDLGKLPAPYWHRHDGGPFARCDARSR